MNINAGPCGRTTTPSLPRELSSTVSGGRQTKSRKQSSRRLRLSRATACPNYLLGWNARRAAYRCNISARTFLRRGPPVRSLCFSAPCSASMWMRLETNFGSIQLSPNGFRRSRSQTLGWASIAWRSGSSALLQNHSSRFSKILARFTSAPAPAAPHKTGTVELTGHPNEKRSEEGQTNAKPQRRPRRIQNDIRCRSFSFSVSRDAVAGVHRATVEPQKFLVSSMPWRKGEIGRRTALYFSLFSQDHVAVNSAPCRGEQNEQQFANSTYYRGDKRYWPGNS